MGIWNSHVGTLPLLVLSGTVSILGNSIGSHLLPIAKVPQTSPALPSHKRAKAHYLVHQLDSKTKSNTQLAHCDSSLIDVLHWCTVIYKIETAREKNRYQNAFNY